MESVNTGTSTMHYETIQSTLMISPSSTAMFNICRILFELAIQTVWQIRESRSSFYFKTTWKTLWKTSTKTRLNGKSGQLVTSGSMLELKVITVNVHKMPI